MTHTPWLRRCTLRLALLALPLCATGALGQAAVEPVAAMRVPTLPAGSVDQGVVPAAQTLSVTLHLSPDAAHTAALQQYLIDVQTPGSASYRQWLTPAQFGAKFGPSAAQIAAVRNFAAANGISAANVSVSPSGLRVTISGTATQIESALAPAVHNYRAGSTTFYANTAPASVPAALSEAVVAVDGLSTAPAASPAMFGADGVISPANDALSALTAAVEANMARVLTISDAACVADFDGATQAAIQLALRQAAAQGITVFAGSACASRIGAGFPSSLPELTSVATGAGITPDSASVLTQLRPAWQQATGLPADALRYEPDLTVSSLADLAQTFEQILARMPAAADGTPARLGNVAGTLYQLHTNGDIFSQPDNAASGTWEPATGLGRTSLPALDKAFPAGASQNNVQITIDNPGAAHGQNITFTATVTNTSGNNALPTPTGTISFVTNSAGTIGTGSLVNGTYSVTTNQLPANANYTVYAQYSGDANYAAANSVTDSFSVSPEASVLNASAPASTAVGQMITFTVTDGSASGVGTPSGTVTVIPQFLATPPTYTGTLSGSGGTATASVQVPATQAGYLAFKVNCVSSDPSFTCYNPINVSANVVKGPSTTALNASPTNPAAGQSVTLTATVSGAGGVYPTPSGSVTFYDYATSLGTAQLNSSGVATLNVPSITGSYHSFTATYSGDGNYNYSNSNASTGGASATTTSLNVSPNPPVSGSTTTLTATLGYTSNGSAPSGSFTFYEDGNSIGTAALSGTTGTFTSSSISGTSQHTFYAVYSGDTNYATSTSSNFVTNASSSGPSATTGTLVVSPNPPVSGSTTTLVDTIHYTSGTNSPSGTVQFYEDGVQIGSQGVNAGVATFTSTTISGKAAHSFYAVYGGDTNFQGNTSNTYSTSASTASTTVAVNASPTTVATGGNTTLTATVTATGGGTAPTGTVTFSSSLQGTLGTANLNGNTATLTPTLSAAGAQSITATYSGDVNYNSQTSAAPVTVTVGPATSVTITANPTNNVAYGTPITLGATATATTTNGQGPTGTINFTLYGTVNVTASVQLSPTSTTTSTGTTTIPAPTPGGYNVQATCTGTNFNCTNTQITMTQVNVVKANTTTTLTSNPASPVAGQSTTFTATVANANTNASSSAAAPTGSVTFLVNGTSVGTANLVGNSATFTTTLSGTSGNTVTAQYSGDANYNTSTSTSTTVTVAPVNTTSAVTASATTGLAGSVIVLTANVSDAPSTNNPTPGTPSGSVSFYDVYNGQTVPLGTVALTQSGPYLGIAQLSTTGLKVGTHNITAVFAGGATYIGSTSTSLTINLTDYAVSFSPPSLTITRGQSGSATATVTALNGFTGQVTLGCVPPAGTLTTCSFTPAVVNASGVSQLVITTTQPAAKSGGQRASLERAATGVAFASLLAFFLMPNRRSRVPMLMALLLSCGLISTLGCTNLMNANVTQPGSGTPLGTEIFTITVSGTDGKTTVAHNTQFQVTVQ